MTKELFGHFDEKDGVFSSPGFYINEADLVVRGRIIPLYLESVPGREWVGLTDDEIKGIIGAWGGSPIKGYTRKLFDQIEEKLKEKNT